ncbi:hypothetical protein ABMA27_010353 [Loxostege sticticalis]|uniref:MULE transposase domain-containing protein n=1 Tax=Loxostege sticticalis TaxID=481309 RepID=A0ABR3H5G3_LOXSC
MADQLPTTSTSTDFHFIDRKGGRVLFYDANQYTKKRVGKNGESTWRCIHYKDKCKGILKIKGGSVLRKNNHICSSTLGDNIVAKSLDDLKKRVSTGSFPAVPTEYNKTVGSLKDAGINMIKKIPTFQNVQGALYRARNKSAGLNKINFKSVDEVKVPPQFQNFLMADYDCSGVRVLVFASEDARQKLQVLKSYYGDGTFKSCLKPFVQLHVIQGEINRSDGTDFIAPLVYALMNKMDTETYNILFSMIKSCIPHWEPFKFKTDFEKAAMKAVKSVFPHIELKGCFYHYSQAIWKKAKDFDLTKSKVTKRVVTLCGLLPLLPRDKISEGWCYIESDCPVNAKIDAFKNYMTSFWLENESFVNVWCVSEKKYRTNNNVEGWNNKLNKATKTKNPKIVQILKVLSEDANMYSVRIKQFETYCFSPIKNVKILEKNDWIRDVLNRLKNNEITVELCLEKLRI